MLYAVSSTITASIQQQLSRTRISNSISSGLKSPVFEPCVMLLAPDVVRGRWLAPFMGMVEHVDLVSGGKIILAFFNKYIMPNHLIYLSGVSRKFSWWSWTFAWTWWQKMDLSLFFSDKNSNATFIPPLNTKARNE